MRTKRGFTLTELLVVLAIMGILIGVSLPAFIGMGRGTNMQTAVAELRSTLALARQWAITHRERTYVVFPHNESYLYTGINTQHLDKALRAYNVYTVSDGYVGEWKYLPPGIWFDPDERPTKNVIMNDAGGSWDDLTLVRDKVWFGSNGNTVDVWAVPFGPDGWLRLKNNSSQPVALYVSEGLFDTASLVFTPNPNAMLFGVEISSLTGQLQIHEY